MGDILHFRLSDENHVIEITYIRPLQQESGLRLSREAEVLVRNAQALQDADRRVEVSANRPRSPYFYQ